MLDVLAAIYIMGLLVFLVLFAFTTWKLGGFDGYARAMNILGGSEITNSIRVQWLVVIFTILWPVSLVLMVLIARAAKTDS